jgi:pyruvate dehydrogenase E1 component alpha subunit
VAVDGNDVEAVRAAVQHAIARARRGDGPTLIEARTWRQRGHWGGDAATYRHGGAPESMRDPLGLQASRLIARREADQETLEQIELDAKVEVATALTRAKELPEAGLGELGLGEVFA